MITKNLGLKYLIFLVEVIAGYLKLNIFLIAGKNDPVIQSEQKFKNLEQFLNKLGYKNIKSKLYPDLRHEILNEKEYEQIYEDVLEFFKQ